MTYPDLAVATVLNDYFVPVRVNIEEATQLAGRFQAVWTPNINIMDSRENIVYHVEGYLPPAEFTAMLLVAHGHFFLRHKRFDEAASLFRSVWEKYPTTGFAPESLYYLGVCEYMATHEVENLTKEWKRLQKFFPGHTWTLRSSIA